MERRLPKLSVNALYRLKWLVGALMAFVSMTALLNLESLSRVPAVIGITAIGACIFFPKQYSSTPPIVWKVFAFIIVPLVSIDVLARETIPALLNLNTWLVIYRALNHQKRREEMQLVLLCLFLLVMTGMLTASLLLGLQLLFFSGLAIGFLTAGTILDSKSGGRSEEIDAYNAWQKHEGWFHLVRSSRYRNLAIGSAMFTALIGIAGVAFLFIPRVDIQNKVNLFNMKAASSQTGFSESVNLGEVTNIKNDTRVALRVDVSGEQIVPTTPYWRILALDSYNNGSFSISPNLKESLNDRGTTPYMAVRYWSDRRFSDMPSRDETRDRWTFFVEPGVSKFLPVLGSFKQFTFANLNELSIGPQFHVFSLRETPSRMVSYQLEGVDFNSNIPDVPADRFNETIMRRISQTEEFPSYSYPESLLGLPNDKAAKEYLDIIVQKITGGVPMDAVAFATRATQYLSESHNYSMSVNLPEASGLNDPVVRWLQSDLDGHCEFFASSLILLSRAAGFPSRVVIGYKGGAWNAFEKYYMVRNSDAHAWCEVFDGKDSWFRVDPTPGSDLPMAPQTTVPIEAQMGESDTLAYVDSLRMLWYRRIVNFDEQAQKEVVILMKDFFLAYIQVAEEWVISAAKEVYSWIVAPWSTKKFLYSMSSLVVAILVLLFQRKLALNYRELFLATFRRGDPIRCKASKVLKKYETKHRDLTDDAKGKRESVILDLKRLRFGRRDSWSNPRIVFKEARRWY